MSARCLCSLEFSVLLYFPLPFQLSYIIIIRSKLFSLFVGREPTQWPANNCLQIMVCSCAVPSNCVWLQIIFCSYVKETVPFSFLRLLLRENGRSLRFPRIFIKKQTRWSNDKTIIELGDRRSIICLSFRTQNKSRYFAQPRPIIVSYLYSNLSR